MANPEGYELIKNEFNAQTLDAAESRGVPVPEPPLFQWPDALQLAHQFNVGWGKYKAPYFPFDELKAFADMAHNCVFMTSGFRRTIDLAGAGDVVYCDPPYEPMPGTAGFTAYAAGGFTRMTSVTGESLCSGTQTWRAGSYFKLIGPEGHRPVPGAWF